MKDRVLSVIGAILLFVCFCDHTFSFQIAGINVRWSQLAACVAAGAAMLSLVARKQSQIGHLKLGVLILAWTPFTVMYSVSAVVSDNTFSSLIKMGWALSSILGAFAIVSYGFRSRLVFINALLGAVLLQASVLVIDSLAICLIEPSQTLFGSAQLSFYKNNGLSLLRPSAFYLEPSYYASMMALALIFVLSIMRETGSRLSQLTFTVGLMSLVLSTSRLGMASFTILLAASLLPTRWTEKVSTLKSRAVPGVISCLVLSLLLTAPFGQPLQIFIFKTNGLQKIVSFSENIGSDGTFTQKYKDRYITESEVSRYQAIQESIASWKTSRWFGHGVLKDIANRHRAPPNPNTFDDPERTTKVSRFPSPSMTTWFELLEESGLLGLSAYLFGLVLTFRGLGRSCARIESALWCATLLGLNYFLTPVFPRFDYWFLSYVILAIVSSKTSQAEPA